jgi:peptide alpha-N-acetyltransferase
VHGAGDKDVRYERYSGEHQLAALGALLAQDLSEPYSVFTYRYFLTQWPSFSYLVVLRSTSLLFTFC